MHRRDNAKDRLLGGATTDAGTAEIPWPPPTSLASRVIGVQAVAELLSRRAASVE